MCVCVCIYALGGELSSKCTPREILRETHTDAGIAYFKYSRSLSSKEKEKSEVTPKKSHKDGNQTDFACLKVLTLIWPSQTSSILLTKNEKYMFPWFDFSQKNIHFAYWFLLCLGQHQESKHRDEVLKTVLSNQMAREQCTCLQRRSALNSFSS